MILSDVTAHHRRAIVEQYDNSLCGVENGPDEEEDPLLTRTNDICRANMKRVRYKSPASILNGPHYIFNNLYSSRLGTWELEIM